MATRNNIACLICENRNPKTNRMCGNKSTKESSVEVAFTKSEKIGWTKKKVSEKATHYYCPKCSHKLKTA
jgi:hypothetical protein